MEIAQYYHYEFAQFLNNIHECEPRTSAFDCAITVGFDRCMARMRDTKEYNPYKRCKMAVYIPPNATPEERARARFCKTHMKKCIYGTVDHLVEEGSKLYNYYKKKNPEIDDQIESGVVKTGSFSQFSTDDFEAVLRKIQKQNSKKQRIEIMSHATQLSFMERTMSIADLPSHISRDISQGKSTSAVAAEWKKYLVQHNKWLLTIREGEELLEFLVGLIDSNCRPPRANANVVKESECESEEDDHGSGDKDDHDSGDIDDHDSDDDEKEEIKQEVKQPVKKESAKEKSKASAKKVASVDAEEPTKKATKKATKTVKSKASKKVEPVVESIPEPVIEKVEKKEAVEEKVVPAPKKTATATASTATITVDEMNEYIENDDARPITISKLDDRESFYMVTNKGKNKSVNPYVLYYLYKKDNTYCPVGFVRDWIDSSDEIPDRFKNSSQAVLDPESRIPIIEVELNARGAMMTSLSKGIYREYEYNESEEDLEYTGNVQQE